jgi:hypothetical protein
MNLKRKGDVFVTIFATDQMAEIAIADNTLVGMGREYKGAPGMHSYCMRQSRYGAENAPPFSFLRFLCLHRKTIIIICHDRLGTSICTNRRKLLRTKSALGTASSTIISKRFPTLGSATTGPSRKVRQTPENERRRFSSNFFVS